MNQTYLRHLNFPQVLWTIVIYFNFNILVEFLFICVCVYCVLFLTKRAYFLLTLGPQGYKPVYAGSRRNRGTFSTGDLDIGCFLALLPPYIQQNSTNLDTKFMSYSLKLIDLLKEVININSVQKKIRTIYKCNLLCFCYL